MMRRQVSNQKIASNNNGSGDNEIISDVFTIERETKNTIKSPNKSDRGFKNFGTYNLISFLLVNESGTAQQPFIYTMIIALGFFYSFVFLKSNFTISSLLLFVSIVLTVLFVKMRLWDD